MTLVFKKHRTLAFFIGCGYGDGSGLANQVSHYRPGDTISSVIIRPRLGMPEYPGEITDNCIDILTNKHVVHNIPRDIFDFYE